MRLQNYINVPDSSIKYEKYEDLYEDYWKLLHLRFYAKLKDYHTAEDLTQETLMKMLTYWHKLEQYPASSIISMLASSVYVDHMRREAGRNSTTVFIDDVLELDTSPIFEYDFMDTVSREQDQVSFDERLKLMLGEDLFSLFEAVYYKGYSVKEVSDETGVNVNTLYWKMSRVKEIAAEAYKKCVEEDF